MGTHTDSSCTISVERGVLPLWHRPLLCRKSRRNTERDKNHPVFPYNHRPRRLGSVSIGGPSETIDSALGAGFAGSINSVKMLNPCPSQVSMSHAWIYGPPTRTTSFALRCAAQIDKLLEFVWLCTFDIPCLRQILGVEGGHTMVHGLQYDGASAIQPLGETLYSSSLLSDMNGEGVFSAEISREAIIGEQSRGKARGVRICSQNSVNLLRFPRSIRKRSEAPSRDWASENLASSQVVLFFSPMRVPVCTCREEKSRPG